MHISISATRAGIVSENQLVSPDRNVAIAHTLRLNTSPKKPSLFCEQCEEQMCSVRRDKARRRNPPRHKAPLMRQETTLEAETKVGKRRNCERAKFPSWPDHRDDNKRAFDQVQTTEGTQ